MKTSRSVGLVGAAASLLATGWAVGTGFLNTTGAAGSSAAVNVSGGTQVAPGGSGSSANSGSSASGSSGSGGSSAGSGSSGSGGSSSASSGSASGVTGTFDGSPVGTRYGTFQVEAVINSGKITDIKMLQSGANDPTSRQITDYALPLLINAVMQQQTWNVGYVSGASYSTQGFESSLKDALSQAGLG